MVSDAHNAFRKAFRRSLRATSQLQQWRREFRPNGRTTLTLAGRAFLDLTAFWCPTCDLCGGGAGRTLTMCFNEACLRACLKGRMGAVPSVLRPNDNLWPNKIPRLKSPINLSLQST
eukprot:174910_1